MKKLVSSPLLTGPGSVCEFINSNHLTTDVLSITLIRVTVNIDEKEIEEYRVFYYIIQ